jgi:hypothetical protein
MEVNAIRHPPRHLQHTLQRRLEIERTILDGAEDQPELVAKCPDCECTMIYRGIGRLRIAAPGCTTLNACTRIEKCIA